MSGCGRCLGLMNQPQGRATRNVTRPPVASDVTGQDFSVDSTYERAGTAGETTSSQGALPTARPDCCLAPPAGYLGEMGTDGADAVPVPNAFVAATVRV